MHCNYWADYIGADGLKMPESLHRCSGALSTNFSRRVERGTRFSQRQIISAWLPGGNHPASRSMRTTGAASNRFFFS